MITQKTMLELAEANQLLAQAIQKAIQEMTEEKGSDMISIKEAEKISGMNSARLRYLMRTGRLEGQKVSPRITLVSRSELEKLTSCPV